MRLYYFRCYI